MAILGLKDKARFQNFQDSGGPFGLRGVKCSRGVWISKKKRPSSGIGKYQFSKKSSAFSENNIVNNVKYHVKRR